MNIRLQQPASWLLDVLRYRIRSAASFSSSFWEPIRKSSPLLDSPYASPYSNPGRRHRIPRLSILKHVFGRQEPSEASEQSSKVDQQSSSFSPHQSPAPTQNVHSHSQMCGLPSRAYYTTTSTRKVVLRQHKEVHRTYRAVKTAQLQCCVFRLRFWLLQRTQMAIRAVQCAGHWIMGDKVHWKCVTFGGEDNHDFSFI